MKKLGVVLGAASLLWVLSPLVQAAEGEFATLTGRTMGTTYSAKFQHDANMPALSQIKADIDQLLVGVNQAMSTYIKDSEISRFNRSGSEQPQTISPDFAKVVAHALDLAARSDGSFDPTIGPMLRLFSFGAGADDQAPKQPEPAVLKSVMERIGYQHIKLQRTKDGAFQLARTKSGVELDLSAVAKGYGVDLMFEYLRRLGSVSVLVEIGGELRASGVKQGGALWAVGIERPAGLSRMPMASVPLMDMAIATSGNYRNFRVIDGQRIGHVMNPRLGGYITSKVASVSVIAPTTMAADGLATALLSMGDQAAKAFADKYKIKAVFVVIDNNHFKLMKTKAYIDYELATRKRAG